MGPPRAGCVQSWTRRTEPSNPPATLDTVRAPLGSKPSTVPGGKGLFNEYVDNEKEAT